MVTPVIFRKYKDGEILALFPTEPHDLMGLYCVCYASTGQHHSADYWAVISQTKLATPDEYADLLRELMNVVGYTDLKVYKRYTSDLRDTFWKQVEYYRNLK